LFLYNVVGFYGVYLGLSYQSDHEINKKLDNQNYQENEMLSVKIPYTLPYQMDWKNYERVEGEFELNGQFYKLVKQKLEHDTLFVVYMKDQRQNDLYKSLVDFVQASADHPVSQKTITFIKSFAKDYIQCTSSLQASTTGWCKDTLFVTQEYQIISTYSPVFSPPPKILL
jgi:hypothetical protein